MKSTTKFFPIQEHSKKKVVINGERPSQLMINKHSHLIRKSSSSSNPIIIYTQSPKVIHTKPHDFMALVQRLTGKAHSSKEQEEEEEIFEDSKNNSGSILSDIESNSSSVKQQLKENDSCDETSSVLEDSEIKEEPFVLSNFTFAHDIPLFTPNFSDSSSRSVFKYSDSPYGILGSLLSPSGLEFMKELPEY